MKSKTGIVLMGLFFCLIMPCVSVAGVSVTSGLTYEKEAQVGETCRGVIQLRNTGEDPQEVKIYQTDYLFFCDGRNIYGEPGKDSRSNADWRNAHRSNGAKGCGVPSFSSRTIPWIFLAFLSMSASERAR